MTTRTSEMILCIDQVKKFVVYKCTCLVNKKVYIGKTKDFIKRKIQHFNKSNCIYFKRALNYYGIQNFKWEILNQVNTEQEAFELEKYWIKYYKSNNERFGYNLTEGGEGSCGLKVSDETRKKLSISHKGKYCGENHPMYGKKASAETRKKLSDSHKGKRLTKEQRVKISKANTGRIFSESTKRKISISNSGQLNGMYDRRGKNNPKYGKSLSIEQKLKLSKANKGRKSILTKEQYERCCALIKGDNNPMKRLDVRLKVSIARKGIKFTDGHREKLRLAKLGKKGLPHSEETKRKISYANKGRHGRKCSEEEKQAKRENLTGRIGIIKDGKQKFVKKDDIEQYVNLGWKIGGRIPWNKR